VSGVEAILSKGTLSTFDWRRRESGGLVRNKYPSKVLMLGYQSAKFVQRGQYILFHL
jgi:hypothetical protein